MSVGDASTGQVAMVRFPLAREIREPSCSGALARPGSGERSYGVHRKHAAERSRDLRGAAAGGLNITTCRPLTASAHLRKSHLLPLIQRAVESQQGGPDGGGGVAHGGEAFAHEVHAAGRGERGLGRAGGGERVGRLERGSDELVDRDALGLAQGAPALDLVDRPAVQRHDEGHLAATNKYLAQKNRSPDGRKTTKERFRQ
jgi:hypothetical protein